MVAWIHPVTLEGRLVRLEPLDERHVDALCAVGVDSALWRWTLSRNETVEEMRDWIRSALRARDEGREQPFATVERATGRVVGSTRYLAIEPEHRRVEVGYTWLARPWQGTGLNVEAKLLLMEHAFDDRGCNRVEFKTDSLNSQSRSALLRIGAVEEGTLRNHMITQGGRLRHTVYFSVIREEWPAVRDLLRSRLDRHLGGATVD